MKVETLAGDAASPRTEQRHPAGEGLDDLAPLDILRMMNDEDRVAIDAARAALPELAGLVELAAERVQAGGRVHYFGAGTSGRLAVLDAAELRPTFSLPADVVVAHIAGGAPALTEAIEAAEDSWSGGAEDAAGIGPGDVVIGLAASGGTPYVGGALEQARRSGATTALIACNPSPKLAGLADFLIIADTGPEVLGGSTRLKAGTAEKLLLNGFSTALMIACGRTWRGLMVSVVATNDKLRIRTGRILAEALGVDVETATRLLAEAGGDLKAAIVVGIAHVGLEAARTALENAGGSVARALTALAAAPQPLHHAPTE
ncbi:MAG: N-acetylmuramic acid 6-phosphate etherase [Microbacteriaceae bacterium]|nr:N-acetylmuramic acid 6-phosphate etherase [Microbacteriaceae bacterium]